MGSHMCTYSGCEIQDVENDTDSDGVQQLDTGPVSDTKRAERIRAAPVPQSRPQFVPPVVYGSGAPVPGPMPTQPTATSAYTGSLPRRLSAGSLSPTHSGSTMRSPAHSGAMPMTQAGYVVAPRKESSPVAANNQAASPSGAGTDAQAQADAAAALIMAHASPQQMQQRPHANTSAPGLFRRPQAQSGAVLPDSYSKERAVTVAGGVAVSPSSHAAVDGSYHFPPAAATPGVARAPVFTPGPVGEVTCLFEQALSPFGQDQTEAIHLNRTPFFQGVDKFAALLDSLGGRMGSYLTSNMAKFRNSKATPSEENFETWMVSELPTHGPSYKGFVDNSAWMANLWIGWTLEFFVEMLALLAEGSETRASVNTAYNNTLYNHHNFIQRTLFNQAIKAMPARAEILEKLRSPAPDGADAVEELLGFVRVARPIYRYCLEVNTRVCDLMAETRKKK